MLLSRSIPCLLAMSALLTGCGTSLQVAKQQTGLSLTIAHVNDVHSHLDAVSNTFEIKVDGVPTQAVLGGFPRLTEAFKKYEAQDQVLKLHGGDALQGSLYYTLYKGEADAALMNTVCFDAMVVGNHEFDDSDAGLKSFINALHSGSCQTPVLGANIQAQVGTPLAVKSARDDIQSSTIKRIHGVNVGIIGVTSRTKARGSTRALASTLFEDEVIALQREVNQLKSQGIHHIVVLSHMGIQRDLEVIPQVSDIDVVIGGDSHTLQGDFSTLGLTRSDKQTPYPFLTRNKQGETVCVAHAWEYGKAMGELNATFDSQGRIRSCGGQTRIVLGTTFQRKDQAGHWTPVDANTRQQILHTLASNPQALALDGDPQAKVVLATFSDRVEQGKAKRIAQLTEDLCFVRVPGEEVNRNGGMPSCRDANLLAQGSDVSQVVTDAFLDGSLAADVAIQNAGGVRTPLAAGDISLDTAFTLLPFANVLVELHMSGTQIVQSLEDAVSHHRDGGTSTGSHPYGAGLRWNLDLSKARGQRFSDIETRDRKTGIWHPLDANKTYVVVANDYIASGKSGYKTFAQVMASGKYVDNYLLYTQTFVDYVSRLQTIQRPSRCSYSHKRVILSTGRELPGGFSPTANADGSAPACPSASGVAAPGQ